MEIKDSYDVFVFDISGTLTEGDIDESGTRLLIEDLQRSGKITVGFSNNPRPGSIAQAKLAALGYKPETFPVFTSGDVFLDWLHQHSNQHPEHRFYHLGAVKNDDLFRDSQQYLTSSLEEAYAVVLTSFTDPEEEALHNSVLETLNTAYRLNKIVLCVNPDKTVIKPKKRRTAGFYAHYYETLGGQVRYFGKPDQASFGWLLKKLAHFAKIDKKRVIMIGDNLETDIAGAASAGIHSALVLTGLSQQGDVSLVQPNYVWDSLSIKSPRP